MKPFYLVYLTQFSYLTDGIFESKQAALEFVMKMGASSTHRIETL